MNILKNNKLNKKYFGYIEGIVYIILIILVIFSTIAGPVIIKLMPLIFVLGIVGRVIFNRPIITSIFGFFVSASTLYIIGSYSMTYILMYSLFCFLSILIGEVIGMYFIKINDKNNEKRYNNKNIVIILILFLSGIFLNSYINGDFYSYLKCKKIIENYIHVNYPNSNNVQIVDGKYVFNKFKYYSFDVKNIDEDDNKKYNFAVYLDSRVIDGYKDCALLQMSNELLKEFNNQIDLSMYKDCIFDIKYTDLQDKITFYITKTVSKVNTDELNKFAQEVNNILNNVSKFNKFSKITNINICIKDNSSKSSADINKNNFYNTEYYLNSLDTEYLDE